MNDIVILILSVCSSLVYRKTVDFCMLILYPVTFLTPLFQDCFFSWQIPWNFHRQSCNLQIGIVYFFISDLFAFYFLISLARTSDTMLNKSDENRHFCLVCNLTGKQSQLIIKYNVRCSVFLQMLFIKQRKLPSIFLRVLSRMDIDFYHFFCFDGSCDFSFNLLIWQITFVDFLIAVVTIVIFFITVSLIYKFFY